MSHLDDDHVHGVVSVHRLFFTAHDLAEHTALNGDTFVLGRVTRYGKGVLVETEWQRDAGVLENGCEFVTHDFVS